MILSVPLWLRWLILCPYLLSFDLAGEGGLLCKTHYLTSGLVAPQV
jgi:hypothetical protein